MTSFFLPPRVIAGPGSRSCLPDLASSLVRPGRLGKKILIVSGSSSMRALGILDAAESGLTAAGFTVDSVAVGPEPCAISIDAIVEKHRSDAGIVIGLGGGSALDAAKAVSAMITVDGHIQEYLEGVGKRVHPGTRLPLILCPTTAGTGSEATHNAVIKGILPDGVPYKRSLRHPAFIPDAVVLDPELPALAPPGVAAASALDALSQLLEAATSKKASPLTDAFVFSGLSLLGPRLEAILSGRVDGSAWMDAQYAAMFSGLGLSHAGLGLVHGIAGRLGAMRPCPHGAVCGLLLPGAFGATLDALIKAREAGHVEALDGIMRLARAERRMAGETAATGDDEAHSRALVERLRRIVGSAGLSRLSAYGFSETELEEVAMSSTGRDSFASLGSEEASAVLRACL